MRSSDVIMTLVYISRYVGRNDDEIHNTYFHYEIYVEYLKDMNRGGLIILGDIICKLEICSYIIFHELANLSCRSSFCNILILIIEMYEFDIKRHHGIVLSNIMFNNYCSMDSSRSCQKPWHKTLKISPSFIQNHSIIFFVKFLCRRSFQYDLLMH